MAVTYTTHETRVDIAEPGTLDTKTVDAWIVNRVECNVAWFTARYSNKATAEAVAAVLTALADKEV
jgi:hypothetical protein